MFYKSKSYTTTYSSDEVKAIVRELLEIRMKFLFISKKKFFGSVFGDDFYISNSSGMSFLNPTIKGQVVTENQTLVTLKLSFPALFLFFFVGIPILVMAQIVPIVLTADLMTINGVLREPTWTERISVSLICIVFPSAMIYFTIFHPLKTLRKKLISKLNLTERA